jgi:hypothetical protein
VRDPSPLCRPCGLPTGTPAATYTSIFALHTASPPSCLASKTALCAPKIKITVDPSCQVTLSNLGYSNTLDTVIDGHLSCSWQTAVPIIGARLNATVDLAQVRVRRGPASTGSTCRLCGAIE